MNSFVISDIRWASARDMSLPHWSNQKRGWEIPYITSRLPNIEFSMQVSGSAKDWLPAFKQLVRKAAHRVVLTFRVSEALGTTRHDLHVLERFLGIALPPLPADALVCDDGHGRTLGVTLEARDMPRSVGILIPHWESWLFLKPCIEAIQRHRRSDLVEKVYILDDSSQDGSYEKARALAQQYDNVEVLRLERPNKQIDADVGLLLDMGLAHVKEQYVAMIDADLFPLSADWLSFPIWLVEKYHCSMVGLDTGLSNSYVRFGSHRWWQPPGGYLPAAGLYDNACFTMTNNLYRVMPTATAKVVAEHIGFTRGRPLRAYPRLATRFQKSPSPLLSKLPKLEAKLLQHLLCQRGPYLPGGFDNGVAANHFIDINQLGPKFNIPITSYIGLTPHDGAFGQNIAGLAFHYALSTRALSRERREVTETGSAYMQWVERLAQVQNLDEVLEDMIEASRRFQPGGYDGSIPQAWYEAQYEHIQGLLEEYHEQSRLTAIPSLDRTMP